MTPRFTPCCGLCVVLVGRATEALPPEPDSPPDRAGADGLALPPEAVGAAGGGLLPATCTPDGLLLPGGAPGVEPLLGAAVPEALPGEDV
jgi:hypothetical protein